MAAWGSAGAGRAVGAVEMGLRRCSGRGDPLAFSPRGGHDRGTGQLRVAAAWIAPSAGVRAGLCLAAEPIFAKLVQLGRLTGELLAAGPVDPLQPRNTRVGDRARRRGGELVQGAGQHKFAAALTAFDPTAGRAASLRVSAKVCGGRDSGCSRR